MQQLPTFFFALDFPLPPLFASCIPFVFSLSVSAAPGPRWDADFASELCLFLRAFLRGELAGSLSPSNSLHKEKKVTSPPPKTKQSSHPTHLGLLRNLVSSLFFFSAHFCWPYPDRRKSTLITMSLLPPEIHTALSQLLSGLGSPDNILRTQAEDQLNSDWIQNRPDVLLMGLAEQIEGAEDVIVSSRGRS